MVRQGTSILLAHKFTRANSRQKGKESVEGCTEQNRVSPHAKKGWNWSDCVYLELEIYILVCNHADTDFVSSRDSKH